MAHTFLSLDMNLIPQSTKDNVPNFWLGKLSNNNERLLIDGYNDKRELVQPVAILNLWLSWSENKEEIISQLLSSSIEYTKEALQSEYRDMNSIWYQSEGNSENG